MLMCNFCCFLWHMLHNYLMVDCIKKSSAKHTVTYTSHLCLGVKLPLVWLHGLCKMCSKNCCKGISVLSDWFPALFQKGKVYNREVSSTSKLSCAQRVLASQNLTEPHLQGASTAALQPRARWQACLKPGDTMLPMAVMQKCTKY